MSTMHITARSSTLDELERTGATEHANLVDGALSVLCNGDLIGITNEYGTCVYHAEGVGPLVVEGFAEHACDLMAQAMGSGAALVTTEASHDVPGEPAKVTAVTALAERRGLVL